MKNYAELHVASAFSFLEGASMPEELAERAAELGLPAVALVDARGVYGAPRFYKAAKAAGVRPLVGAELAYGEGPEPLPRVSVLISSQKGYRNLCRLISQSAFGRPKGEGRVTWDMLEEHAPDLYCLTGGDEGLFRDVRPQNPVALERARQHLDRLSAIFPNRLHVELQRHHSPDEEFRNQALLSLARERHVPVVATNGVRYARREDKDVFDVLTCIREHTTLESAGRKLSHHREACLKSPTEMAALFADLPEAISASADLAERLSFTLDDLGYQFPHYPLPTGETPASYLRKLTWAAAPGRFPKITVEVRAQLEKELALIEKLNLAGYFLIVWDIIQFCQRETIFVQGRGSAANSAVCYSLSITAVDPIRMKLLFERFLSEERGEWPDIDLDLPSGNQREKVIQYLYKKYGAPSAAMTANLITYRPRSAMREVAKVFGFTPDEVDRLSKHVGTLSRERLDLRETLTTSRLAAAGFPAPHARLEKAMSLCARLQGLPRHLGQHSGGMVLAAGRLDEIVPIEPAAMEGRYVIQWDKEDCADLGIIKVDILGLGMLQVMEESMQLVRHHEHVPIDMARLPEDDPAVYDLLRRADTVGLFQVESRAQIATLPRHPPRVFYDIVTQIALVRPGPILGGMMRPFFNRFEGKEAVVYPHPCLIPVLERTLGIPIFQEQILRIAIVAAGFSGGQAEQLRRAMGSTRSAAKMRVLEKSLMEGMARQGIELSFRQQILKMIYGFASYGFPESHAASFALIAYASAYLKVHHGAAFYTAMLNAWPLGFYHPATLVKDAERRGIFALPIDINESDWVCKWDSPNGFRIGLRYVQSLSQAHGHRIELARAQGAFRDVADLARRCELPRAELESLAHAGALQSLGLTRRAALWQVAQVARPLGPLFQNAELDDDSPLPNMDAREETVADLQSTHLTVGPHLMQHCRQTLRAQGVHSTAELRLLKSGVYAQAAGLIIVRQHPPTAKGFVFVTLEDETGMTQAILAPSIYQQFRALVLDSHALVAEGVLQLEGTQVSIKTTRVRPLSVPASIESHDFH